MTNEQILAYGTLLLALFTAAGVVTGVLFYWRQCNAQIFLEYTKRYDEVMNKFPADARRTRLDLFAEPSPESEELTLAVLRYLNLSSEEYYRRSEQQYEVSSLGVIRTDCICPVFSTIDLPLPYFPARVRGYQGGAGEKEML